MLGPIRTGLLCRQCIELYPLAAEVSLHPGRESQNLAAEMTRY